MIEFSIYGHPATQGSKKVVPIYKAGAPMIKNGRVLTRVVNDNPKTAEWRQEIAHAARQAYRGELLTGPLCLAVTFYKPRPKGHFGSGRNAGTLKESAEKYPISKPDTVKLVRALEDSLTGVIWKDDSQVVTHVLHKRYGEYFKVEVCVLKMEDYVEPGVSIFKPIDKENV